MFKIDFEVEKLRNYQKYETSINNPTQWPNLIFSYKDKWKFNKFIVLEKRKCTGFYFAKTRGIQLKTWSCSHWVASILLFFK